MDHHWPLLGSARSVVRPLMENSQVTKKNHMLFMDCFYNSVALFHLLKNELGDLAAGTVMPSRKQYPKELSKSLTEHGRYEFWCLGGLCAIARKDHPLPEHLPRPEEGVHGICSRFQFRIATVIHITAYDLTNCTHSELFAA